MVRMFAMAFALSALVGQPSAQRVLDQVPRRQVVSESRHTPPVDAPVLDPFRPPPEPWMAGNRGIEYDTGDGEVVRASADGVVTFAGQVGGHLFVTIRHSPDLLTTVGFVSETLVVAGDRVTSRQPIALAGETMHFTARRHGQYIDPESLFVTTRIVVRLVTGPG